MPHKIATLFAFSFLLLAQRSVSSFGICGSPNLDEIYIMENGGLFAFPWELHKAKAEAKKEEIELFECPVCLEEIEISEEKQENQPVYLPCNIIRDSGHKLCPDCTHKHFITHKKNKCPLCRFNCLKSFDLKQRSLDDSSIYYFQPKIIALYACKKQFACSMRFFSKYIGSNIGDPFSPPYFDDNY